MTKPIISFILPGHNVEAYVAECINSIRAQPVQNIEVIYVDDFSNDKTLDIVKELAAQDNRIKIIAHTNNKGSYAARNTGLSLASGEWIAFIDPDDIISPIFYETIHNFLDDRNHKLVIFNYEMFNDGAALPKVSLKNQPAKVLNEIDLLKVKDFTWLKLIRLDWLRSAGILFYEGKTMWDILFHWRVCLHAKLAIYVDENLIFYRQRTSASSYQKSWYRAEGFAVMDSLRNFLNLSRNMEKLREIFYQRELNLYCDIRGAFFLNSVLEKKADDEIRQRISPSHWDLLINNFLKDKKKSDYLLTCCRPADIRWDMRLILPAVRYYFFRCARIFKTKLIKNP